MLHQNLKQINMNDFFVAANFPKTPSPNPARIPPQTPPAGGKSVEAKRKILSPRKKDFRFAESVLKPHALPSKYSGSAWGFLRAYALVSLHHARGACDIICFGNRCEFGTIDTQRGRGGIWYTRTLEVRIPQGLEVRVLSSAQLLTSLPQCR